MSSKKLEFQKKISIHNRKASHDYQLLDRYVAGIALKGSEVKSIRMGRVNMQDSFCVFIGNELFARGINISAYEKNSFNPHVPKSDRKLLLTKKELRKIESELQDVGITVIPSHIFINDKGLVKLEIAIAKGKKMYDKRESIKAKDQRREMEKGDY